MPYKFAYDQRFAARAHYEANRDDYRARAKEHKKRQGAALQRHVRQVKDNPCVDCGFKYPYYVMQFDHVRGIKLFNIGDVARNGGSISMKRLIAEISKCDLVCANCHAERTHQRGYASLDDPESAGVEPLAAPDPTLF